MTFSYCQFIFFFVSQFAFRGLYCYFHFILYACYLYETIVCTSVVVPYCSLFMLSVFILWFTYVSDIFSLNIGS